MTNNERLLIALRLIKAFEAEGKTVTDMVVCDKSVSFIFSIYMFTYYFDTKKYKLDSYSSFEEREPLSETITNIIKII